MKRAWSRLIDRYFIYRERYVAYFREEVPARAGWAIASEVARLTFVFCASALCAFVFVVLTYGSFVRARGPVAIVFAALLAVLCLVLASFAARALAAAIHALQRHRRALLKK